MQQSIYQDYSQMPSGQTMQMQQVPVSQDEMYATLIQEDRIKNIIAQISPDNQLYELEMRIKGYRKNIHSGMWEKINPKAREVNPLLVDRFMAFLGAILNQGTSLSNLSTTQINDIMKVIIEYIADDIDANQEEYELKGNYSEMTRIGLIMVSSSFMVLNRALNGSEARRMWSSLNVNEALNPMQQKKGFMDALKFWKQ